MGIQGLFWAIGANVCSLSFFVMGSHHLHVQPVTLVVFTDLNIFTCVVIAFFQAAGSD